MLSAATKLRRLALYAFIVNIKISLPALNLNAKKEYYSYKIEQAKNNLKETWKIIKM